jgi:hypothetical protein
VPDSPESIFNECNNYEYLKNVFLTKNFFSTNYKKNTAYYKKDGYLYTKYLVPSELDITDGDYFEYKINSQGFRGKDFNEFNSNNINILFGGCSHTLGAGLPENNVWCKKLSDKIKFFHKNNNIDFYNVSVNGSSIELIVKNVIAFIKNGNIPNYIFLFLPETSRKLSFNKDCKEFQNCLSNNTDPYSKKYYSDKHIHEDKILINFILISLLEELCKNLGIKLLWTSWDFLERNIYVDAAFDNHFLLETHPAEMILYPPDHNKQDKWPRFIKKHHAFNIEDFNIQYENKNNETYWHIARDGLHYGSAAHNYICESFFKELEKINASI